MCFKQFLHCIVIIVMLTNQAIMSVAFRAENRIILRLKKSLIGFENTIYIGNLAIELSTDLVFKKKPVKIPKPDRIVYF